MDFNSMLDKLKQDANSVASAATASATNSSSTSSTKKRPRATINDINDDHVALLYPQSQPVRTVYLACPANACTGGPEAMHQLCHVLNSHHGGEGIEAKMLYLHTSLRGEEEEESVHHARDAMRPDAYGGYHSPPCDHLPGEHDCLDEDEDDDVDVDDPLSSFEVQYTSDLVIWPECWTTYIDSLPLSLQIRRLQRHQRQQQHQKRNRRAGGKRIMKLHQSAIWWLSVNNNNNKFSDWKRDDILHLYQSEYARNHLTTNGARHIWKMTEYISDRVKSRALETGDDESKRDLDVLYNPLKGMHYTDEILRRSGKVRLTPIGGGENGREWLSPEQVTSLLKRAKIYIDFGHHPGMDRIPREAALCGCIVITNRQGAARYHQDLPIPSEYKIGGDGHVKKNSKMDKFDAGSVCRLLKRCLEEYDVRSERDFRGYREWILGQEARMWECVGEFVNEVVLERMKSK